VTQPVLSLNAFNWHASLFGSPNHVRRSASAGEGDHKVRFPLIEHPLVTDTASGLAVGVPIGWE
jgi:hypothetical protein